MSSTTKEARAVESDDVLTYDEMFFLLSSERRRLVVKEVYDSDDELKRSELSDRVTAGEYGEEYSDQERNRVHISLYQVHLDKLADAGVIDMDDTFVRPGKHLSRLYSHLDTGGVRSRLSRLIGGA